MDSTNKIDVKECLNYLNNLDKNDEYRKLVNAKLSNDGEKFADISKNGLKTLGEGRGHLIGLFKK